MRPFFDTNVLVYAFDEEDPDKREVGRSLIQEHLMEGDGMLSVQVLQEFYVNATRKLADPLSPENAGAQVRDFARLPLVRVDEATIIAATERRVGMSLSFRDALIIEAAFAAGADALLTENIQHGQEIGGPRVQNPFL